MSEKFDEFSKHLVQKHSRRGAFKLFGAGIVGAAVAAVTSSTASADRKRFSYTPKWNSSGGYPSMNQTLPSFNQRADDLRDALQLVKKAFSRLGRD